MVEARTYAILYPSSALILPIYFQTLARKCCDTNCRYARTDSDQRRIGQARPKCDSGTAWKRKLILVLSRLYFYFFRLIFNISAATSYITYLQIFKKKF